MHDYSHGQCKDSRWILQSLYSMLFRIVNCNTLLFATDVLNKTVNITKYFKPALIKQDTCIIHASYIAMNISLTPRGAKSFKTF